MKVNYLKDHLSRMWTRFNTFLGIQTAIVGAKFLMDSLKIDAFVIGIVGLIFSILWYMLGSQDRYLFKLYQKHVELAFHEINKSEKNTTSFVGQVDDLSQAYQFETGWFTWRKQSISSTKMAAIVPFVITCLWVVQIICIVTSK